MIEKFKKYTDLELIYQSEENVNDLIDSSTLPTAIVFLPNNAEIIQDSLGVRKRLNVLIMFVDKTHFDFNAEKNQKIISEMEKKAMQFLSNLQKDNKFYLIQNYGIRYFYDYFDANVTGVGLSLLIEETNCVGYE